MKSLSSSSNPFPTNPGGMIRIAFLGGTLLFGQWFFSDLIHLPGGGLGVLAAGAGVWWLSKPMDSRFDAPVSVQGWIKRCREVLEQFEDFQDEEQTSLQQEDRHNSLKSVIRGSDKQSVAIVSASGATLPDKESLEFALESKKPYELFFSLPLSLTDSSWVLPNGIYEKDLMLYLLPLPLRAADLLWLEQISEDQPSWLMVPWEDSGCWRSQLKQLQAQLPQRWSDRVIRWNGSEKDISSALLPIKRVLGNPKKNMDLTRQRLLSRLHCKWQKDLEELRRIRFRKVQRRTQWIVAGAVFASPVASADLLAVSVVNGLMVKEMAKIWSCSWQPEVLKVVARQLAVAAIGQGIVEWSGQALIGVAKLDGTSWFAAGTLQALSAAYLTRVVGRSMADWLALNNGVSEFDLEAFKSQAPELVAIASEKERLDWSGFLKQAKSWLSERDQRDESRYLQKRIAQA